MPSDPVWQTIQDDLRDTLRGMSKATGYWFDYGGVVEDASADWDAEKDFLNPRVFLTWDGEVEQDQLFGAESATNRFRHYDRWLISVAIKGDRPSTLANRVRADVHKALISGDSRCRTLTRATTFDAGVQWEPFYEGGAPVGGLVILTYTVQWDHVSGDMTTQ